MIEFPDGRVVTYETEDLEMIEHANAITIHKVPGIRVRYCHHPLGESLLYDAEAEYPVHRHYPCKEKGVSGGAMERSLPGSPYGRCRQAQYSSWGADHPLLLSIPE